VDMANAHVEGHAERRRAKTEGEVDLIKAATRYGVEQLGADPALAERAFQKHFRKIVREQDNTDAVLREALEDLSANPPDEASSSNQAELSEEFLDRLEDYSATASTNELRKRWGRVLASEVRKPGAFSGKVLRIVDEMSSETALQFEAIVKHRIERLLAKSLVGKLEYNVRTNLVLADLIVEPGLGGQIRYFSEVTDRTGQELWLLEFPGTGALSIPRESKVGPDGSEMSALTFADGKPAVPCYLLTDVGEAIATILPDQQHATLAAYAEKIADANKVDWIRQYVVWGKDYRQISENPGKKDSPAS